MKTTLSLSLVSLLLASAGSTAWAQVYRCAGPGGGPPEYINNAKDAQARNCKPVSGGNVTVVQGTTVPKATAAPRVANTSASTNPRPDGGAEQRSRDSDSRIILG